MPPALLDVITWRSLQCDVEDGVYEQSYRKSFEAAGFKWLSEELPASIQPMVRGKEEVRLALQRVHAACTLQKQLLRAQDRSGSQHVAQEISERIRETGLASLVADMDSRQCHKRVVQCLVQISRLRDYLVRVSGDPFIISPEDPFHMPTDQPDLSPFPAHVAVHILQYLTASEVCAAALTNSLWLAASADPDVWEELCVRRWGEDQVPPGAGQKAEGWRLCYFVGSCRRLVVRLEDESVSLPMYPELRFCDLYEALGVRAKDFTISSRHFSEQLELACSEWDDGMEEEVPCYRISLWRPSGVFTHYCSLCELVPVSGEDGAPLALRPDADTAWKRLAQKARPLMPPFIARHVEAPGA
eukprot:TRINITY_DN43106_c0_g1_i1.p1 TRINITY_DN43106_c0_g1~~TRINITY_DN43106_c0_g1_i1.p1  ORF type:complete len:377 (+),score=68.70 TRINITY_DN43106_c0_g1_i1:58-1131(+)